MSNKTPYEIRLELLKLAKDVIFEPIYNERDSLMQEYHSKLECNRDTPFPIMPVLPSTEQVIREAEKMNEFISRQGYSFPAFSSAD